VGLFYGIVGDPAKARMDWFAFFDGLSSEEKDAIALLRVIECTNGVIQYAFRRRDSWALSEEDTRSAMKFSMGCMKRLGIIAGDKVIRFSPETEAVLRQVRQLYIDGFKKHLPEARSEFYRASEATVRAVGSDRLLAAAEALRDDVGHPVLSQHAEWGLQYLSQFL